MVILLHVIGWSAYGCTQHLPFCTPLRSLFDLIPLMDPNMRSGLTLQSNTLKAIFGPMVHSFYLMPCSQSIEVDLLALIICSCSY